MGEAGLLGLGDPLRGNAGQRRPSAVVRGVLAALMDSVTQGAVIALLLVSRKCPAGMRRVYVLGGGLGSSRLGGLVNFLPAELVSAILTEAGIGT